ncbi:MAG: hypothetical protein P8144_11580 [Gammaproteobacteria bacterium]
MLHWRSSGVPKLAIALGSGHVNEPLETTTVNRFYVVLQENVFTPPENGYTTLTETNLDDRTNVISDSPTSSGWYITLENSGEKQLSSPLTVSGNLIFSTYEPSVAVNACSGATGIGRVYLMDIGTAEPNEDLNNSNNVDKLDRHRVLASPSIPPTPKLLFPEDATEPVLLIGPEQPLSDVSLVDTDEWERTFWYENQ